MNNLLLKDNYGLRKTLLATVIAAMAVSPVLAYADELDELRMFVEPVNSAPKAPVNVVPQVVETPPAAVSAPVVVSAPPIITHTEQPRSLVTPVVSAPVKPLEKTQPLAIKETPVASKPALSWSSEPTRSSESSLVRIVEPATAPPVSSPPVQSVNITPTQPVSTVTTRTLPAPAKPSASNNGFYTSQEKTSTTPSYAADDASTVLTSPTRTTSYEKRERAQSYRANQNPAAEVELKHQFATAIRSALLINPKIQASMSQSEAAEANIDEAKGQRWPQVDVSAASPNKQFGSGNRTQQNNLPTLGVSIATNLYDFGQTSRTIESKEEQFTAASQDTFAQKEDIAWQVSSALIEQRKQQVIIDISRQYVQRMQELTTMLSGIVQADAGRRSELTQARGRLLQAQSLLENAESRERDSEITLRRLLGGKSVSLPPSSTWAFNFGSLDEQLRNLDHHPGILKAAAESRAAMKEAEAVKASGKPKLNWVVSKNTAEDDFGRQQSWQTGLNVSWGLFRGGSNNASERSAVLRAEASKQLVQEQMREYEQRIRAADQDAHSMQSRANLYGNLTVESDRIRKDFFDQWYHLGKRTLLDVLSAETDYYNNRVSEVSNRMDSYTAIFRGYASAGYLVNWLTSNKP
jgi:adhesin transport system outer membrane protein